MENQIEHHNENHNLRSWLLILTIVTGVFVFAVAIMGVRIFEDEMSNQQNIQALEDKMMMQIQEVKNIAPAENIVYFLPQELDATMEALQETLTIDSTTMTNKIF